RDFADKIAGCIARHSPATVDDLLTLPLDDESPTVDAVRRELVGKVGEKIDIRRFQLLKASGNGTISCYLHGVRIGVLVSSTGGPPQLGRDIAMHVAASKPVCTNTSEVPEDVLTKEREIYLAQARESGKPEDIVEKMVSGRLRKFVNEISLVAQPFVKQPDQTVADLLQSQGASVEQFVRFEVGEGIQKRDPDDFVAEVLAQAKGD
ncbi:MAG: translation elongation factor Ts, partial [Gammaproteobacteria bacterium]|nr:translation elongation factor Ts [Gammaproteobacteria bacterium]